MQSSARDPRAQKHREAEKRHREKLADNLEHLRSVIPGVSSKEQKAEIYAKAAAYVQYLRSMVPTDKWIPPSHVFASIIASSPHGLEDGFEEPAPRIQTVPSAVYQQQPMFPMQYMPLPAPTMMPPQMSAGMSMLAMRGAMMGMPGGGPPGYPMYYADASTGYPYKSAETAHTFDMQTMQPSMQTMPYAAQKLESGSFEDGGMRKRKFESHPTTEDTRPGTSDSGIAISVDATATASGAGSIRKVLSKSEVMGEGSLEGQDGAAQKSSNRRRRRVEESGGDTPKTDSRTPMLDALASLATSSNHLAHLPEAPTLVTEAPKVPFGGFPRKPTDAISPSESLGLQRDLDGLARLSLSKSTTSSTANRSRYQWPTSASSAASPLSALGTSLPSKEGSHLRASSFTTAGDEAPYTISSEDTWSRMSQQRAAAELSTGSMDISDMHRQGRPLMRMAPIAGTVRADDGGDEVRTHDRGGRSLSYY